MSDKQVDLQSQVDELIAENYRLAQQNLKLVLLAKEKDKKLYYCELALRRYRTRLIRWFEDMAYDPLEGELSGGERVDGGPLEIKTE